MDSMRGNANTGAGTHVKAPLRLSPLYVACARLGAQFQSHGGWQVPQVYSTTEVEASALQESLGVADIGAVGKVLVVMDGSAEDLMTDAVGAQPSTLASAGIGDVVDVDFEVAANSVASSGAVIGRKTGYVARLADDEYLLVTPIEVAPRVMDRIEQWRVSRRTNDSGARVLCINRTSGLGGILLAGPHSIELLSKLSALPIGEWSVAQTSVAKVRAIVARRELGSVTGSRGPTTAFELYVDRSYTEYLWDAVLDAGAEFGIRPVGAAALTSLGVNL